MKLIILLLLFINLSYGQFEIKQNDRFDKHSVIHGMGSFVLAVGLSATYKIIKVEKPALCGAVSAYMLGFFWEVKDGFWNDGFSGSDIFVNTCGVIVGSGLFATLDYFHSKRLNVGYYDSRIHFSYRL